LTLVCYVELHNAVLCVQNETRNHHVCDFFPFVVTAEPPSALRQSSSTWTKIHGNRPQRLQSE